ncbi:hypothetical protein IE077_000720, partial [Cardiosporidium cionae]
ESTFRLQSVNIFNSSLKNFVDPSNTGVSLNLSKGNVKLTYPLVYELDVFENFTEDVFLYNKSIVGNDPFHYCYFADRDACANSGKLPRTPTGKLLPWHYGRCCWCPETLLLGSTIGFMRARFSCNILDLAAGSVWTSKSCPRVSDSWYSAFRIENQPRVDSSINVSLEWWGKPSKLKLILNWFLSVNAH